MGCRVEVSHQKASSCSRRMSRSSQSRRSSSSIRSSASSKYGGRSSRSLSLSSCRYQTSRKIGLATFSDIQVKIYNIKIMTYSMLFFSNNPGFHLLCQTMAAVQRSFPHSPAASFCLPLSHRSAPLSRCQLVFALAELLVGAEATRQRVHPELSRELRQIQHRQVNQHRMLASGGRAGPAEISFPSAAD